MARIEDFKAFVASYKEACERGELEMASEETTRTWICLLYTSPSPRD